MRKLTTLIILLLTVAVAAVAQTDGDGASKETAIILNEGTNTIDSLLPTDKERWYKAVARAQQRTKITFTGYPTMQAYLGNDLAESLGITNPIDYINQGEEQEIYICLQSTNNVKLTATVSYSAPVADLSLFGKLAYSVEKNADVEDGSNVTVTFPNRVGGLDEDAVTLNYYIFSVKGGNPDGAPVNLGGNTVANGTLGEGVAVRIDGLNVGKKYRLAIQSLVSGSHYAPGYDENTIENGYVDFYFAEATGITDVIVNDDDNPSTGSGQAQYNLAGQRVNGTAKGVIISNGKKYVK